MNWLTAAGKAVAHAVQFALSKVLPVAAQVAHEAEPIVELLLPAEGPIFKLVVEAVIATEAAYAAKAQQSGTGAQKLQSVLDSVNAELMPALTAAGLSTDEATKKIGAYVNAIVAILNGPTIARAVPNGGSGGGTTYP